MEKEKINIAELLKDCPKGMELDYALFEDTIFIGVEEDKNYPILIKLKDGSQKRLTKYGGHSNADYAKCVIFPKGKTTWEGFVPPCNFKDGDILANDDTIFIYNGMEDLSPIPGYYVYVIADKNGFFAINTSTKKYGSRFATEEEKNILFEAIKNNGYKWYPDTKTLTKLPMFKDGYVITCNNSACTFISIFKDKPTEKSFRHHCSIILDDNKFIVGIKYADYANPRFATEEEKSKLFKAIRENGYRWNFHANRLEKLIKPIFKKGDKVRIKKGFPEPRITRIIEDVCDTFYTLVSIGTIDFTEQDNWELVPNKFDINTLKPFESRVLVRDKNTDKWKTSFWGFYDIDNAMNYPYECCGNSFAQCIPYKGNEHLLGTTDDCDEFYKTWEK